MTADVTLLLQRWRQGDRDALAALTPLVYDELHRVAAAQFRRERSDHTLQATSLVHEAYLRFWGGVPPSVQDRAHFLALSARTMRQVLVEHARRRGAQKRDAALNVPLQPNDVAASAPLADILTVNEALDRLATEDARLASLVEMRHFAGMTAEECACALGESVHVVRHDLRYAQAWLRLEMSKHSARS